MKIARFIAAVALLGTAAILSASAQQQKPAEGAGAPAAAPQSSVAVPDSKMAMIYSDAFLDPKTGISRFNALLTTLNREFQPRQTELNTMQQRIAALQKEITDTQAVADPKTLQQKGEKVEEVTTEHKRKAEEGGAGSGKRKQGV